MQIKEELKNKKQMEIYNDAYGMLKILDDKNLENVYTNKKQFSPKSGQYLF